MYVRLILTLFFLVVVLLGAAVLFVPSFGQSSYQPLPATEKVTLGKVEPHCPEKYPEWRKRQVIEGITVEESPVCSPDDPAAVAAFVKGTNNVSHDILMKTQLAPDAVVLENDRDGDGDPDVVHIRLEVAELNGYSPDIPEPVPAYFIAPGIQPGFWVFAPKTHGMATVNFFSVEANPMLRMPSPTIRVEAGDTVKVTLENTHYFPHTIHFHGVDHPFLDEQGEGNDGVPDTSELPVMPGESRTYDMTPRQTGTMLYHCHVQPHAHLAMGLLGMFVVEENRPNNWVQTLNVGAGHVRYPAVAIREAYDQEYDLLFQDVDRGLHDLIKTANDPRLIAKAMRLYDVTDELPDYYLVNGRSAPYTMRESSIVVEPNQDVKLRVANGGQEGVSLHSHGHKMTITHYDGVEHNPAAWITRDVYWLSTVQRLDLHLKTVNNGLHSYGEGIWMLHNHVEKGFTNDGMHPGGANTMIVYKSFLDETGMPKTRGEDMSPAFTKEFYEKKVPVWTSIDKGNMLGDPGSVRASMMRPLLLAFLIGLLGGGIVVVARSFRKRSGRV
jgi:Putative multicopper oxidases